MQGWRSGFGPGQCWLRDANCTHHGAPQPEGLLPASRDLCLLHFAVHHLPAAAARAAGAAPPREHGRWRNLHPPDPAPPRRAAPSPRQEWRGVLTGPWHAVAPFSHRGCHGSSSHCSDSSACFIRSGNRWRGDWKSGHSQWSVNIIAIVYYCLKF